MPQLPQKRIVYLWGAGATHAEASFLGAAINLLMRDTESEGEGIATRILNRIGQKKAASYRAEHGIGVDIEKLITLLSATGVASEISFAEEIRRHYFLEIRNSLDSAGVLPSPRLSRALLALHANASFSARAEKLSGFISTNHDGLLQTSFHEAYGGINLGFPFTSSDYRLSGEVPPLLQLHGSFTWTFGVPTRVSRLRRATPYSENLLWIPPTTLKDARSYPFNKLSGIAFELLTKQCDVLRVVGSSLTQNDWNILSLIFSAQRHLMQVGREPFKIELIMPHEHGERLRRDCSYLRSVTPIGYLTDGDFAAYKESGQQSGDMGNPLAYWLKEKVTYHLRRGHIAHTELTPTLQEVAGEASTATS